MKKVRSSTCCPHWDWTLKSWKKKAPIDIAPEESVYGDKWKIRSDCHVKKVAEHVIMHCITLFQMDTRSGKIDLSKSYSPDALYNLFHFNIVLTLTAESCLTLRLAGSVSQYWLSLHKAAGLCSKSLYSSVGVKCGNGVRSLLKEAHKWEETAEVHLYYTTKHILTSHTFSPTVDLRAIGSCESYTLEHAHKPSLLHIHTNPCSWPEGRSHQGCICLFLTLSVSAFNTRE